jgi:hypothetical protein
MKPMAKGLVLAALRRHGCRKLSEDGKHEKWGCPQSFQLHVTLLPRHDERTAGVLRNLVRDLKCLSEGWLQ